jgi:hypothetical protein
MPRMGSDPVTGKKPEKLGMELNCLSCHDPHTSQAEHLLREAATGRGVAKNLSLGSRWDFMGISGMLRDIHNLQGPFPWGRL